MNNNNNEDKYQCGCGSVLKKTSKHTHEKTKKHLKFLGEPSSVSDDKYTCECGSVLKKTSKKTHEKSKKHLCFSGVKVPKSNEVLGYKCVCGSVLKKSSKCSHEKSKKHLNFISKCESVCEDESVCETPELKYRNVIKLGSKLLNDHNLNDWKFELDNAKTRAGVTKYVPKIISISRGFVIKAPDSEILNTILHEIAHALVGHSEGHNKVWKAKAIDIGCDGERCHQIEFTESKYVLCCSKCLTVVYKTLIKTKRISHPERYISNCCKAILVSKT